MIILVFIGDVILSTVQIQYLKGFFIKRQTSGKSSDNEWQWVTANDNEWYNKRQRVTTNDNEWYDNEWQGVVQQVATSGTASDNEWQRVTTYDNE